MKLFGRRPGVPAEITARAELGSRETVLAAASSEDGTWLLGTREALVVLRAGAASVAPVRIPWQRVETADWNRDSGRLRVTELADFGTRQPRHEFAMDNPADLLQLVRERVTATVLMQRRVTLAGRRGFFVIARRAPGGDGEITWAFRFDPGVDPADPAVGAAADQALALAQDELGDVGRPI